jgi:N-acetylneuraminic acid mutarotase
MTKTLNYITITVILVMLLMCSPANGDKLIDLGDWKPVKSLPTPVFDHATTLHNGIIYVTGGRTSVEDDQGLNSVYYTSINEEGKLVNWRPTTFLPINVYGHTSVVYDSKLYIIGGNDNITVYHAPIHGDGSIGRWEVHSSMFYDSDRGERMEHTTDVYKYRMYVTGGHYSQPEIEVSIDGEEIETGDEYNFGDVPAGEEETITFTIQNTGAKQLRVYGISLFTSYTTEFTLGNFLSAVDPFSSMDVDVTFTPDDELPKDSNIKIENSDPDENPYTFILRGNTGRQSAEVIENGKSKIPDGTPYGTLDEVLVGPDWKKTVSFPTDRSGHSGLISDDGIFYIVGGEHYNGEEWESLNDVRYGSITPTGEVISWSFTHSLTVGGISGHTLLLTDDTLLVVGGIDDEDTVLRKVFYSSLYDDGSADTWKSFVSTLPEPVYDHTSVSYNGFIYVIGGRNDCEVLNSVYYSEIEH